MNLKKPLFHYADRWGKNRALHAMQNGMILMLPFICIHAIAAALLTLPFAAWQSLLHNSVPGLYYALAALYQATANYFSVLLTAAISYGFAREWHLKPFRSMLLSLSTIGTFWIFSGQQLQYLTTSGICTAIVSALFTSAIYLKLSIWQPLARHMRRPRCHINTHLYDVIYAIPLATVVFIAAIATQILIITLGNGVLIENRILSAVGGFLALFDGMPLVGQAVYAMLSNGLWFFGIDGQYVFYGAHSAFVGQQAQAALTAGAIPDVLMNQSFLNSFMMLGGSGSALALILTILWTSRQKFSRQAAKMSLLPAMLNVGSVLVLSLPIIGNPIFLVPFVLIPVVNLLIAYGFTTMGAVPRTLTDVPDAVPVFLNGMTATGSLDGAVLQFLLLGLDMILYRPFVLLYDDYRATQVSRLTQHMVKLHQWCESRAERINPANFNEQQSLIFSWLSSDLAEELDDEHPKNMFMVYQPQVDSTGHCIGAEALIRWNHPNAGFIYPPLIITLAKQSGLLPKLEQFIFRDACECIATLEKKLGTGSNFKISVNITGDSLLYDGLNESVKDITTANGISPEKLWIEITEQDTITLNRRTEINLKNLRDQGHKLIIDDFGMGQTSINYLQTGIFGMVKLDGSITKKVLTDEKSQQIISSLTDLSKRMDLVTVAEYVDNVPQRDKLRHLGCDIFQGYLYSPPVSKDDFIRLMTHQAPDTPEPTPDMEEELAMA